MASPLVRLLRDDGPRVFYTEGFRRELEAHLTILRTRPQRESQVADNIALRYQFDLFGLLTYLDVPSEYHWITMRVNNLMSPTEYVKTYGNIIIPDLDYIETLRAVYTTSHRVL